MEKTLVMVKPDGVRRGLTAKVIERVEREGFIIKGMKKLWMSKELASSFYKIHEGKEFFQALLDFICSGPVVALLVEGVGCVERMRKVVGATDPSKAEEGTLRAEFGEDIQRNVVHASDSNESAMRELSLLFFQKREHSIFEPIDITTLKEEKDFFFEEDPVQLIFEEGAEDVEFASPLRVWVSLKERRNFLEARGRVETTLQLCCTRCLEPFEYPVKEEFLLHYHKEREEEREIELKEEDFKEVLLKEGKIRLFEQIREVLLLTCPINPICNPECRGLCARCGKNLNKEECICKEETKNTPFSLLKRWKEG